MKSFYQTAIAKIALLVMTAVVGISGFAPALFAQTAYTLEDLPMIPEGTKDFVVGPGKVDVALDPGKSGVVEIMISNRMGEDKNFSLSVEDITGSRDPQKTVVLLGSDRGPHSLRDLVKTPTTTINIPNGKRARVPITISIPADAQPGGRYGSVIVSTVTRNGDPAPANGAAGTSPIITQIGTVFLLKVNGPVIEKGELKGFSIIGNKMFASPDSVPFSILFENSGNVHLNPYGIITVKNMIGGTVGTVEIDPWFALPDSLRYREVVWEPPFLFGRYTAELSVNRGYSDMIDTAEVSFWVIPWKIILITFIGLTIFIFIIRWILSKFKIIKIKK